MQKFVTFKINQYEIKQATLENADAIYHLIKDTAHWIDEKEINQWNYIVEGGGFDEIEDAIRNHQTFMVKKDGQLVATFSLNYSQKEWDQNLWGDRHDDAVYLHKLAISRHHIGGGLGTKIINWAQEYLKENGKPILRLDCVANNEKLVAFYTKCGLENMGTTDGFTKFEKYL